MNNDRADGHIVIALSGYNDLGTLGEAYISFARPLSLFSTFSEKMEKEKSID